MRKYEESIKLSAIVSYITMAFNIASAIVITPIIIEVVNLGVYGLYSMFGGLILVLSYLDLGIGNATTRFTAKYRYNHNEFDKFTTNILFLCGIIVLAIVVTSTLIYVNFDVIFIDKFDQNEKIVAANLFYIMAVNLCLTVVNNVFLGFSNGFERFFFPRILKLINVIVRFIAIYLLIHEFKSIYIVVLIDTFLNMILSLVLYFYVNKKLAVNFTFDFKRIKYKNIKMILNFSFWLFVYSTIFSMLWEAGKVMSGLLLGSERAAIYGLAVMLSGYVSFFSVTVTSMYLPLAIKLTERNANRNEVEKINIYVGRVSLIVFSYLILGFVLVGKDFILLWLGPGFSELYLLTLVMMLSFVLPLTQHFLSHLLEAKGYIKYKAISLLFFVSIGLIFLIYFYELFGLLSFAVIPMISLQIFQLSQMIFYSKKLKINIFKFITQTYLWFTPFVSVICIGIYFLDRIVVDSLLSFVIKGSVFTILFSIVLYFYIRNRFIGWFKSKRSPGGA